jgi:hypothetical protein
MGPNIPTSVGQVPSLEGLNCWFWFLLVTETELELGPMVGTVLELRFIFSKNWTQN